MEENDVKSTVNTICRFCSVRKEGVCAALNEKQIETLSKVAQRKILAANSVVSLLGNNDRHYGNLIKGVLKLSKMTCDGRQQTVGLQFANDFVGELFNETNQVDIITAGEAYICVFPKEVLDTMLLNSVDLNRKLNQSAWRDLEEARNWLLALGRKNALEKIASFLSRVALRSVDYNEKFQDPIIMEMPLNRGELADFLGLTIETVSRKITLLRKYGVLEPIDRHTLKIRNLNKLIEMGDPDCN